MAEQRAADAFAKVNLGLIVSRAGPDGYHPLVSLVQSVSWADRVALAASEEDAFTVAGMDESVDNLAWRAVEAVRAATDWRHPVALHLDKRIAVAAGLGGGSADAAAGLALAADLCGLPGGRLPELAISLGADVPFCLTGGLAVLEGRGERISPQPMAEGFALGIVVPAFELSTPAVYRQWDEVGEPVGDEFPASQLPPGMRGYQPLRNDLQPAAESLVPELADWRADLADRWSRPVAMSGSGPALFGFFVDEEEAGAALADAPGEVRVAAAVRPVPRGWREVPGTMAGPE
jgi:4-diphosphocytidyl-2-C-methyl-D-erythritol kinase